MKGFVEKALFITGLVLLGAGGATGQTRPLPPPASNPVDFGRDIAPVLKKRCVPCHGAALQQSGLRLDSREALLKGGSSGPVIAPGDSAGSRLIRLVGGADPEVVMPPAGPRLSEVEVGLFRAWIDTGAVWPQEVVFDGGQGARPKSSHWSFQPILHPQPPSVQRASWLKNPIDAFVLAKLESEGIEPSPEAEREKLIRRLSLDLTGLPPTPDEVASFMADSRPDAYQRQVDRLLDSPHFGEKWAVHWLDQARYADSDGYEKDSRRPHAWRWREWVINAFNNDLPFDQFTIQQIAGDLLPNATVDQKVATGFHRNTPTNREGGVNIEMFRFEQVVDRASTVGSVWLGLTVGCAQCHDHKYDPISQKEFYQLYAYFNNADEVNIEAPLAGEMGPYLAARDKYYRERYKLLTEYKVLALRPDWERRSLMAADSPGKWTDWDVVFDTIQKMVDDGERILRTPVEKRTRHEEDAILDHMVKWYSQAVTAKEYENLRFKELGKKLAELKKSFPDLSRAQTIAERSEPTQTHIHIRGSWKDKGVEVRPATPAVLPPLPAGAPENRLTFARWLVSDENPLTARVIVNRYWQELFGAGLVDSPGDFGTQGSKPSHPELLDWLASEFRLRNWSTKQILRLMVTSATYRQSARTRPELLSRDPNNRLLAHQNAFRLPAEVIRDSALAASGLLDPRLGGKSVEPHLPESLLALTFGGGEWVSWSESQGSDKYRRALYIHRQRTLLYPMLVNFDAPNMVVTACKRERSNTPLQALNLLNDPVFVEMAQGLANRVMVEATQDFHSRLCHAWRLALARDPKPQEEERMLSFYQEQVRVLDKEPDSIAALFPYQPESFDRKEAAAWVALSRVILNLDEFLTRE
ncbi:MAG: hypothetical protein DMG09_27595 [Acidobacteria bacterium]|nr:MAG: hypothetical protein DMG09_27595 [Acidobacteriota bacterium]